MPANRDVAASIGLTSAVDPHPGFQQHVMDVKRGRGTEFTHNAKRSGKRGFRVGRRAASRG